MREKDEMNRKAVREFEGETRGVRVRGYLKICSRGETQFSSSDIINDSLTASMNLRAVRKAGPQFSRMDSSSSSDRVLLRRAIGYWKK